MTAGLRAILMMPVRPQSLHPGAGACMMLVALITAMGIGAEWWLAADAGDRFNWSALRSAWFDLPLIVLGGAWLAQARSSRVSAASATTIPLQAAAGSATYDAIEPIPPLHFTGVMLASSAWIVAIAYGLLLALSEGVVPEAIAAGAPGWIFLGAPLWSYLVAARTIFTMNRTAAIPFLRRFVVLLLLAVSTVWSLIDPLESYWESPGSQEPVNYIESEEFLELQPRLLETHLSRLQPQRPAVSDLYFIGFAPYASEDVFRKELDVIHPLMDQRFDTAGRSLRLVNHADTLRDFPIATVSNLRRALSAVAARMDLEEDVLLLYVTTHGSRNAVLATDLPPLKLYNIDPPTLKSLLDESGIRNRVLIISACYSGTFIAPLRTPGTLIMTASVAERPSFGCGAESEFTYFGNAIFNQALRQTVSFEEAFTQALPAIQEREEAEGFEPSQPQIAVGDDIRQRLSALEKRLAPAQ
jgi:hypothetical protein